MNKVLSNILTVMHYQVLWEAHNLVSSAMKERPKSFELVIGVGEWRRLRIEENIGENKTKALKYTLCIVGLEGICVWFVQSLKNTLLFTWNSFMPPMCSFG